MDYSCRKLIVFASMWAVVAAVAAGAWAGGPQRRNPFEPFGRSENAFPQFNPQDILESKQKELKKDVARLSEIVEQLQKQLEDNDTKNFLSLDVLRKTEEIEKLAKRIKSLVRG